MSPLNPCLWFDGNAEEAVNYYLETFDSASILHTTRYTETMAEPGGQPVGQVMTIHFVIDGVEFMALNGGSAFQFSPATSFMVYRETQAELDHLWDRLGDGGQVMACGWLTDRFGITWQVLPRFLVDRMTTGEPHRTARMHAAMLTMQKLDVAALKAAYDHA